jgi:hypothetical protein
VNAEISKEHAVYIFRKEVSQVGDVICYIEVEGGNRPRVRAKNGVKEDVVVKTSNFTKLSSFGIRLTFSA